MTPRTEAGESPFTPSKRRSIKMEPDSEEMSPLSWSPEDGVRGSGGKKRKRGPGRPRKPDHELARPRRNSSATKRTVQSPIAKRQLSSSRPLNGKAPKEAIPGTSIFPGLARRAATRLTADQVTIAAQKQQIETMENQIRQYQAHIMAIEARRDSLPPTPALSIGQPPAQFPYLQAHPSLPDANSAGEGMNQSMNSGAMEFDREDSPLSVYSGIWTPELLAASETPRDEHGMPLSHASSNNYEVEDGVGQRKGKGNVNSLIITLKANPIITPTATSVASGLSRRQYYYE